MRTVIYWFSGTGNSFYLAKSLQEGLEDAEEERSQTGRWLLSQDG